MKKIKIYTQYDLNEIINQDEEYFCITTIIKDFDVDESYILFYLNNNYSEINDKIINKNYFIDSINNNFDYRLTLESNVELFKLINDNEIIFEKNENNEVRLFNLVTNSNIDIITGRNILKNLNTELLRKNVIIPHIFELEKFNNSNSILDYLPKWPVIIRILKIDEGVLKLSIQVWLSNDVDVVLKVNNEIIDSSKVWFNAKLNCLDMQNYLIDFIFDLNTDNVIEPYFRLNNEYIKVNNLQLGRYARINKKQLSSIIYNGYRVSYEKKKFVHIRKEKSKLNLLKPFEKKIWLFQDRILPEKDNAYFLFQYCLKKNKNCYYISSDPDLLKYGNVIEYNTESHLELLLKAQFVFCSHYEYKKFNPFINNGNNLGDFNYKVVYLSHGLHLNDTSSVYKKSITNFDYLLTVLDQEVNLLKNCNYQYTNEVIKLGFPRFDNLLANKKDKIFIFFTWRKYLYNLTPEQFEKSNYYMKIKELLESDAIKELNKNYIIEFGYHTMLQSYKESFEKFNKSINVVHKPDFQKLVNESKLLITDYSSIVIDFAITKTPIVCYQFDQSDIYKLHTIKENWFKYEMLEAVTIINQSMHLIEYLNKFEYKPIVSNLVKDIDNQNCSKIYNFFKGVK